MTESLDNIQRIAIFGILLVGAVMFIIAFGHYTPVPVIREPVVPVYYNMTYTEDPSVVSAIYFYGDGCKYCPDASSYLAGIEAKYPNFTLEKLEIYNNNGNLKLMSQMCNALNVSLEKRGVPLVIIGDVSMSGMREIREGLEPLIKNEMQLKGIGVDNTTCNKCMGAQ
jgi:glutaredoxin